MNRIHLNHFEGGMEINRKGAPGAAMLKLTVEADQVPGFFQFLQKGVRVEANTGCSVKRFLCDQLHMNPDYIEERVQTCFLDGKAVDDIESAMIRQGSTLTLSGAMPGLLGATLRKGSYYASMRNQISHKEERDVCDSGDGYVILKLFNLIIREVGPDLLMRGVWIEGKDLEDFFKNQDDLFWSKCREILLNDEKIEEDQLAGMGYGEEAVFLQVRVDSEI